MNSFRLRLMGALGFAFLPLPWDLFHLVLPAAHAQTPTPVQTPRTWSRSSVIRLPVQIDSRTRASLAEIKLFVKAPGPISEWVVVQSGPPTQDTFEFRADKDGEYAFMFVTIDKVGRSSPSNLDARPPHQIIVVDTTPPELSVQPLPVANREIYLQCRVRDAYPDLATVKLEYQVGENSWNAMSLARSDSPGVFRIPHAHVLEGKVRASASDKAGNVGIRVVDLGDPTRSYIVSEKKRAPDLLPRNLGKTVPDQQRPTSETKQASHQGSNDSPEVFEIKIPDLAAKTMPGSATQEGNSRKSPATPEVAASGVPNSKTSEVSPSIVDPGTLNNLNVVPPREIPKNTSAKVEDPYFPPLDVKFPVHPTNTTAAQAIEMPVIDAKLATNSKPAMEAKTKAALPTGPSHPIISTHRCTLDYTVENVIIGGQTKIEFWATKDSGRSWNRIQDENGGRTPAKLVLPGDGVYGIRVKANAPNQPPQVGEAPDAWVEVDTTAPSVRLTQTNLGTGADAGTLTIQWAVQDKNLIADSINIYQASRPDGPWLPIATGLRNDGAYRWLIPAGIGTEVYIRLEATDRAGNLGRNELRDPVVMPLPKVRVLGIGPAR